ncbi:MAG: DUF4838 domain-containing protein, partial [Clostridia bacterium]|nr:DUF4838 domain-containing protein [Clostridia bacterium]
YNYNGTYGTDRQTTNFNLYIGTVEFVDSNYEGVKETEYYSFHDANSLNEFDPENNNRGIVMATGTTYDGRKDDWVNITYIGSDFTTAKVNFPMKYTKDALLAKLHAGYTKIRIPLYFTGLETPRTIFADYSSGWYYRQNLENATLTYVERNLEDIIADYNYQADGTHSFLMIYNNTYDAYESVRQLTTFNLCIGTIEFVKPAGVDVVKNSTTDYCLVLPENPSRIIQFAAKELNQFFYQATGLSLPVIYGGEDLTTGYSHFISLGNTARYTDNEIDMSFAGLKEDGFVIKCVKDNVYINSSSEMGVLWGVYRLLEDYVGVKFLSQEYTYVPTVSNVVLNFETVSFSPEFTQRDMLTGYKHPYFYRVQQYGSWMLGGITDVNWASDLGNTHTLLNYFYVPVPDTERTYTTSYPYSSNSGLYMNRTTSDLRTTDAIYTVNGADNQRLPFDICPSSGINTNGTMQSGTNAAQIIKNTIIDYLKIDNTKTFFMLGIMDQDCECLCSTCKSRKSTYGGYSGVLTVFCNAVVNEVNAWIDSTGRTSYGVDHYINVVEFAYYKTSTAPTKAYTVSGVNINYPNEHVYVYYTPLHSNFLYGYND